MDNNKTFSWHITVKALGHPYWRMFYARIYIIICLILDTIILMSPNFTLAQNLLTALVLNIVVFVIILGASLFTKKFENMTFVLNEGSANFGVGAIGEQILAQHQPMLKTDASDQSAHSLNALIHESLLWKDVAKATYFDKYATIVLRSVDGKWLRIFTHPHEYSTIKTFVSSKVVKS